MSFGFSGYWALILGGSCELALCLAGKMITSGLFPILSGRTPESERRIHEALVQHRDRYATVSLDFSRQETLDALSDSLREGADYLVDFAQSDFESLVAGADDEAICDYFAQNVSFRAKVLRRVTRAMLKQRRGRLVFVSSAAAVRSNPGQGFYAAAKQASESLYRNIGLELGRRGVTTVSLRAGYIEAGRGTAYIAAHKDELQARLPTGRPLTAEQVVQTLLFLLSDSATGFNATELVMDGGMSAGK